MHRIPILFTLVAACATVPPAEFDPSELKRGDKVGAWTVEAADVLPDPAEQGWIGSVRFAGETSVSGTFQPHPDSDSTALCFFVDERDRIKLPRFENDVRKPWFCFTNEEDVRRVATAGQKARIRVADYHYRHSHTDVHNSVRLVRLE